MTNDYISYYYFHTYKKHIFDDLEDSGEPIIIKRRDCYFELKLITNAENDIDKGVTVSEDNI